MTMFDDNTMLLTYPMHGQRKLVTEGYRTRDGHLIEWFGKILASHGAVGVVSRPEPRILNLRKPVYRAGAVAGNTYPIDTFSRALPNPLNKRDWWLRSVSAYADIPQSFADIPAVVWNPFTALAESKSNPFNGYRLTTVDLLDDWTIHYAYASVSKAVNRAYAAAFEKADFVTANAEGTADLAKRYGRSDVIMLPNGVDAHRFMTESRASGSLTVGYVGKIGRRIDLDLVLRCADNLPEVKFIFAGPILDKEYKAPLSKRANIELRGDVHYDNVPELLTTFDLGWVPHRVGEGEVGGDVIKTYEYRAAHLPVLTTPVEGAQKRGLTNVTVLKAAEHENWFKELVAGPSRVPRAPGEVPQNNLWSGKAKTILSNVMPNRAAL